MLQALWRSKLFIITDTITNKTIFLLQDRLAIAIQSCAFTSSGANLTTKDEVDRIVGLEMNTDVASLDAGRRVVGQVCFDTIKLN